MVLETIEHRRQKEYWARAAADGGLTAALEVAVRGAGVMDVAITGGAVDTDIEVQHTAIPAAPVKTRTTRYARAGYLPVWFNDAGAWPPWLAEVPAIGCNPMPWDTAMPRRRQVTATGLGVLRVVRCDITQFGGHCPDTGARPCGRYHPAVTGGRTGLTVDDVAAMLPAGQLVPLRYRTGTAFLVSPEDFRTYLEMTGGQGHWPPGGKTARGPRTIRQQPQPCRSPRHDIPAQPADLRIHAEPAPRERRHAPAADRKICPVCQESELTYGRAMCQACGLMATWNSRAAADFT
ncbi:MAG TPA: hypothetical protein VMV92_23465 [Streptosporangiaceae bacterium]|nr:hypothetical protein [Streptosporangiaceae bacterium]